MSACLRLEVALLRLINDILKHDMDLPVYLSLVVASSFGGGHSAHKAKHSIILYRIKGCILNFSDKVFVENSDQRTNQSEGTVTGRKHAKLRQINFVLFFIVMSKCL